MFEGTIIGTGQSLKDYIDENPTMHSQSQVIAEWNLNMFDNIQEIGNYKNRPAEEGFSISSVYPDTENTKGMTDSDILIGESFNENDEPEIFLTDDKKRKALYSLEDCFDRFRPRSGINKAVMMPGKKMTTFNPNMFQRPRYYMASPDDKFKYWTSYRNKQISGPETLNVSKIKAYEITANKVYGLEFYAGSFSTSAARDAAMDRFKAGYSYIHSSNLSYTFVPLRASKISNYSTGGSGSNYYFKYLHNISKAQYDNLSSGYKSGSGQTVTDVFMSNNGAIEEFGIANTSENLISDAAPFIVYKNSIPTNRIVIKMQTHVGKIQIGDTDPFYGYTNQDTPKNWSIQALDENGTWQALRSFSEASYNQITGPDGYVELAYGVFIPQTYRERFIYAGKISSIDMLPEQAPDGYAYLLEEDIGAGVYYIYSTEDSAWDELPATYSWIPESDQPTKLTNYVTNLVSPDSYIDQYEQIHYREFQYINGLRIVVDSMNTAGSTFDLIELSPRLTVDISDMVTSVKVSKGSSSIGDSGLAVDSILVSTGDLSVFDYDNAFNVFNENSILNIKNSYGNISYNLSSKNLQIKIYDALYDKKGNSYHIPIKTLYADGFPELNSSDRSVSIKLRDMFSYFESMNAPELLYSSASLSFIIASVLDSVGFSNYIFKRTPDTVDPIVPYFFVQPNTTVSTVLESIALSTQTAIFFDEYNNLVFMSKEYLLPNENNRTNVDYVFYGSEDHQKNGVNKNEKIVNSNLANIIDISSQNNEIFNDGKIVYSSKSIMRQYSNTTQAYLRDSEKQWKYQNVLLWEATPDQKTKPINDDDGNSSGYTLSALTLKNTLSANVPKVTVSDVHRLRYYTTEVNGTTLFRIVISLRQPLTIQDINAGYINLAGISEDKRFNINNLHIIADPQDSTIGTVSVQNIVVSVDPEVFSNSTDEIIVSPDAGQAYVYQNNFMDCGETAVWMSRYNGYFYANGEIIRYNSAEFSITGVGNVWISSPQEYKQYFHKMSFGGNMYPTGRIRIYAEPNYDPETGKIVSGNTKVHGRGQFSTSITTHQAGLSEYWYYNATPTNGSVTSKAKVGVYKQVSSYLFDMPTDNYETNPTNGNKVETRPNYSMVGGYAGSKKLVGTEYKDWNANFKSSNTGPMRNLLASKVISDRALAKNRVIDGTIQSSALAMTGSSEPTDKLNYVSCTHKLIAAGYNHFGTRLRIIGQKQETDDTIAPIGNMVYRTVNSSSTTATVQGASAGIAWKKSPESGIGYYFEIVAITDTTLLNLYDPSNPIYNLKFYKVGSAIASGQDSNVTPKVSWSANDAIAIPLWEGKTSINVDDGLFAGQYAKNGEETPTVYDIAFEYQVLQNGNLKFYLYLNNILIGSVVDSGNSSGDSTKIVDPKTLNYIGLFVRGNSKAMFENVYAVGINPGVSASNEISTPIGEVFEYEGERIPDALQKYGISGIIKNTFLSGVKTNQGTSKYNIYFEEFGTIMREAAYMNIKYDKSFPAIYAKLLPTFYSYPTYTIAGFVAGPYGAQFLIFNSTDTILTLDQEAEGIYLRIGGVSFTSKSDNQLSVDDYFKKYADVSESDFAIEAKNNDKLYQKIKISRMTYGTKAFNLDANYIQNEDAADEMMGWLVNKMSKPRRSVGLSIFSNPLIQLGDIVNVVYSKDGENIISDGTERFTIYNIEYSREQDGPQMNVYLSEVV